MEYQKIFSSEVINDFYSRIFNFIKENYLNLDTYISYPINEKTKK